MRQNPSEDGLLRSYFLGEMSQEEMEELEKRFGDDEFFELAEAVESDLLAAAVRGELAPAERERVLKRLASSPQGRERLAFVRALNKAADEEKRAASNVARFPVRPVPPWASALAASLLVTVGLTFYVIHKGNDGNAKTPMNPTPVTGLKNPVRPQPPETVSAVPPAPVPPPPAPPERIARDEKPPVPEPVKPLGRAVLQLALLSGREAGTGEIQDKLPVKPDIGFVELQLDVSERPGFESFDLALRNQENQTVWQGNGLKPRTLDWSSAALVFEVGAEKLAAEGRYKLDVWGRAGKESQSLSYVEFEVVTNGMP